MQAALVPASANEAWETWRGVRVSAVLCSVRGSVPQLGLVVRRALLLGAHGARRLTVAAQHDSTHLGIPWEALHCLAVLDGERAAKLAEQVLEEDRVADHGDVDLGPAAQPLQERTPASLARRVILLHGLEELVLFGLEQREIDARKLGRELRLWPVPVAHEVGDALAAELGTQERGRVSTPRVAQREHGGLQAARQRRDHDEVEVERLGVAPHAFASDVLLECCALCLALGREPGVPVLHARILLEQHVLLGREGGVALRHVVRALRVTNKEDPLAALLQEERESALLVVAEAVGIELREEVLVGWEGASAVLRCAGEVDAHDDCEL
mmetsp:Transcript_5105/g.9977  ORF Transcript_5105/g.9977 Transcript_5105/m.9977 type:complete len:328 (+) Transcript_5105:129-1112(+)